jgi:membrane protease YdiL (CAAX protease family)
LFFFSLLASTSLIIKKFIPIQIIGSLISYLVIPIIALGTLWLGGHYLDNRKFKDYGFNISRRWWLDFILGFILSALLFFLVFLFEKAMGWIKIVDYFQNQRDGYIGMPFVIPLIMGEIFFGIVGLYEEILFRAYPITNLSEGLNKGNSIAKKALTGAYILSAIIFGLFHSGNSNATILGVINIILLGLVLGLPYILSGELSMSIAFHISWNFFQGLIFGFPVNGEQNNLSIIAIEQGGPQIWTGGSFGPEGGLIGSIAIVLGCAFILLWFRISQRPISLFTKMAEYDSLV